MSDEARDDIEDLEARHVQSVERARQRRQRQRRPPSSSSSAPERAGAVMWGPTDRPMSYAGVTRWCLTRTAQDYDLAH